jgi:hypothetical protein
MPFEHKEHRRFAIGASDGPDIANLQRHFWRHAIWHFREIQNKWREFAVPDDTEPEDPLYTQNEFLVDAAVAIVLAGTSIAELVGQNLEPEGGKTPDLRPGLRTLLGPEYDSTVDQFVSVYDNLRHFGPAKHDAIFGITEEALCEHMTTAQNIWRRILAQQGGAVDGDFAVRFTFE